MANLSPAAQAVMDAYVSEDRAGRLAVAAAFRAGVDEVVPEPSYRSPTAASVDRAGWAIRDRFLAIVAELEGIQ